MNAMLKVCPAPEERRFYNQFMPLNNRHIHAAFKMHIEFYSAGKCDSATVDFFSSITDMK
jgi:hypothetical protein